MRLHKRIKVIHLFFPISLLLIAAILVIPQQNLLMLKLTFLGTLLYVTLSLVHHYTEKSLTMHTILEYILVATLVLVLVTGTTM